MDTNKIFEEVIREQIKSKIGGELEAAIDETMLDFAQSDSLKKLIEDSVREMLNDAMTGNLFSRFSELFDELVNKEAKKIIAEYLATEEARKMMISCFSDLFAEQYGIDYMEDTLREDPRFYEVIDDFLLKYLRSQLSEPIECKSADLNQNGAIADKDLILPRLKSWDSCFNETLTGYSPQALLRDYPSLGTYVHTQLSSLRRSDRDDE